MVQYTQFPPFSHLLWPAVRRAVGEPASSDANRAVNIAVFSIAAFGFFIACVILPVWAIMKARKKCKKARNRDVEEGCEEALEAGSPWARSIIHAHLTSWFGTPPSMQAARDNAREGFGGFHGDFHGDLHCNFNPPKDRPCPIYERLKA
ncbi:hypothetical protein NM208_g10094 [Fusarium decemcellulare]|uniref:Uncharacterized protein n=1 Tax=Fusarium decemcellulare TaxID=57161 RepID=A0ACC1RZ50_9HYPO|nr:hypothetical protein NM208_g10094 [Fusarium decemcellulare]